jgi:hypothetical protein
MISTPDRPTGRQQHRSARDQGASARDAARRGRCRRQPSRLLIRCNRRGVISSGMGVYVSLVFAIGAPLKKSPNRRVKAIGASAEPSMRSCAGRVAYPMRDESRQLRKIGKNFHRGAQRMFSGRGAADRSEHRQATEAGRRSIRPLKTAKFDCAALRKRSGCFSFSFRTSSRRGSDAKITGT